MARRRRAEIRKILPDPRYNSVDLAKFINNVMLNGKKTVAQRIVYSAIELAEQEGGKSGFEVFEQAIRNSTPMIEVRSRRVGGANYQVPTELPRDKSLTLAMRWIIESSRSRSGSAYYLRLARELMDAYNSQGPAIKRKDDIHKMAEANKAFAHFKW